METEIANMQMLTETEMSKASTDTLKAALASGFNLSAKWLLYLANIWRELENRGEDLTNLRSGLSLYLPMIANGTLDAQVVVRYAGQTMLINAIAQLSLANQRDLLQNSHVKLVVIDNGEKREIDRPLNRLSSFEIRTVFDNGRLRSLDEQFLLVGRKTRERTSKTVKATRANVKFDATGEYITVGRTTVFTRKIFDALADHFGGIDVEAILSEAARNAKKDA